jgi:GNAT superfamily N-acetyltransferase
MEDAVTSKRDQLLAFELALDEAVCDEVRAASWGRAFLTPSAPLVWAANWVGIERTGMALGEILAIADEALGAAGCAHRSACVLDEADGHRLAAELEAAEARWPGWEVERTRYMLWRGGEVEPDASSAPPRTVSSHLSADTADKCERHLAREVGLAEIAGLRKAVSAETMPAGGGGQAAVDQLFELDRRYGDAGGDRWFAAPADGEPLSCCRLLTDGRTAQVEDVATLARARERGYAKAIVLAAIAAAQADGVRTVFLTAEAADWPQLFYARLGFETIGDLTVLRRRP